MCLYNKKESPYVPFDYIFSYVVSVDKLHWKWEIAFERHMLWKIFFKHRMFFRTGWKLLYINVSGFGYMELFTFTFSNSSYMS
jgi:hypothetical protein